MADRIKGITIEIGGNTTELQTALKDVNKQLKDTQADLKDVNKLLKLDPSNTELLQQKQKLLKTAIGETKNKLDTLNQAQQQVAVGSKEWDALQREIVDTKGELQKLEDQYKDFGSVATQKIHAAGESMKEFGGKISNVGQKLQPISTAAAAVGTGLVGLAYKSITASDDLNTLAKQTGFTTAEIQKMQYAADRIDVSFEDIAGALKKLKPKLTDNNATLQELGISIRNADGSMRSATDVFYDAVVAIGNITNETERDQKAMELFGKGADSLSGILDDGGAALREYGKEAEQLGLIMSQETLDSLNEVNDAIDKAKAEGGAALAQLGAAVAQVLVPAVKKLAPIIDNLAKKIAKLTPEQAELILKVVAIVAVLAPLITTIGKLTTGIGALLTVMNPTTLLIAAIAAAVIALTVVIVKNWDKIKEWTVNTWNTIRDSVSNAWNGIKSACSNAWNGIKSTVVNAASGIANAVNSKWANMKSSASSAFNSIASTAKSAFDRVKSTISGIVDKLKNIFNFEWSLPKIKLPHFSWNWRDVGGFLKLPDIKVEWYQKAYDNPYLFTDPTILAGKGFGDGGGSGEIVYGRDQLMRDIAEASQGEITINVYASNGMNIDQLTHKIEKSLTQLQRQRANAYA